MGTCIENQERGIFSPLSFLKRPCLPSEMLRWERDKLTSRVHLPKRQGRIFMARKRKMRQTGNNPQNN